MAVVIETTLGDITVDLYLDQRPVTCLNFLKLCKMKYYNYNLFHSIRSGFIAQTGDPTGEGSGGQSVFGLLEGPDKRFFSGEKRPKIRHNDVGLLSMVGTGDMMIGSQFFFTLAADLDSLDDVHCVIGEVTEGQEVLRKLNDVICDESHRPYRDVRITHTVVLEDPFNDPVGLRAPSRSPSPSAERLKGGRIAPDEEIDETMGKSAAEIQEMIEEKEAKARATILEIVGDLPDADIAPPENVLFVCKLNPVTTDDDLEIIFSRFGKIVSCEVIRDKKTGDSLQYAFIEFADKKSCEDAYFKMGNVLIDDRRIHVDFSQSVSKMKWLGKGRGVKYFNDDDDKSFHGQRDPSRRSPSREREHISRESDRHSHNSNKKLDRECNKSIKKRSRSPIDRKTSRSYKHSESNHTKNNVGTIAGTHDTNKDYKNSLSKDQNGSNRKDSSSYRLQSSPTRDRKRESPRNYRDERNNRSNTYRSKENKSRDRKDAKDEESKRTRDRKEGAAEDHKIKYERNSHYTDRAMEYKLKDREDRSRNHKMKPNRQDLSSDDEKEIRVLNKKEERSRDRNNVRDEKYNKNTSKDIDSKSRDRVEERVGRYERNNYKSGGDREDRSRYRKEERDHNAFQYKNRQNSIEDRSVDRKDEKKNERRAQEETKSLGREERDGDREERDSDRDTYNRNENKCDKENTESRKRKHRNEETKSIKSKKAKTIDPKNSPCEKDKRKRLKNKEKQKTKNQKVSKKKRKQSTSSESSSESSSSSESTSSDDSHYKKKTQRRRKKKYSTSSTSSSGSSTSSSSSSSSESSSSSSSSSSDSDNKKESKKKYSKKKLQNDKKL